MGVNGGLQGKADVLSEAKRALVEKRIREAVASRGKNSAAPLPVLLPDHAGRFRPFPLTPFQQVQHEATVSTGVSPWFYLEARCHLDIDRLESSFQRLLARHDMLRAVVHPDGSQQAGAEVPVYRFVREDLSSFAPAEQEARIAAIRAAMLRQPKSLHVAPPFEIRVTRVGPEEVRLHLGYSMQVFDLASFELMAFDWRSVYEDAASAKGEPLELSFRDMVLAEPAFAETSECRRSIAYWQERFKTLPEPAALIDYDWRTAGHRFAHRDARIDEHARAAIRNHAQAHGVTEAVVTVAAFQEVVSVYAGQSEFTIETRLFRKLSLHKRVQEVCGQFVAGLVTPTVGDARVSFAAKCRRLEQQTWKDLECGYVDAARLRIREHGMSAEPGVVYTSAVARFEIFHEADDLPMKWFGPPEFSQYQTPDLGLEFFLSESHGGLGVDWFWNDALFAPGKVERMFDDYCALLNALAAGGGAWVDGIEALATAGSNGGAHGAA